MIYGQYAKSYGNRGGGNYKVVSESDAIINYLIKEQNNYNNLLLNESYITEEERLVMEAKYEVLQEAVAGALIAAIIAILSAIVALIVAFIKMMGKGSEKLKEKVKSKETSEQSDDKDKKLIEDIKKIVDDLDIELIMNTKKDDLMNFSYVDLTEDGNVTEVVEMFKSIKDDIKEIFRINKNTSADEALKIVNPIYDTATESSQEITELKEAFSGKRNLLFEMATKESIQGGPTKAKDEIKKFANSGYFDRAKKDQEGIRKEIDEVKSFIDKNARPVQKAVRPDMHGGDKRFTEVSKKVNGVFSYVKGIADNMKNLMNKWAEFESFRFKYCNIVLNYC